MSEISTIADLYEIGKWKNKTNYKCKLCPFSTVSGEAAIRTHIATRHLSGAATTEGVKVAGRRFAGVLKELTETGKAEVEVPDLSKLNSDEVLKLVDDGVMTAAEALVAESAGKNRKKLIRDLEKRE